MKSAGYSYSYGIKEDNIKNWFYHGTVFKASDYFINGKITEQGLLDLYNYFRKSNIETLANLQEYYKTSKDREIGNPINVDTVSANTFCWSLVNQFLDLIKFQRIEKPPFSLGDDINLTDGTKIERKQAGLELPQNNGRASEQSEFEYYYEDILYISGVIKGNEDDRLNKAVALLNNSANVHDIDDPSKYSADDFKVGVKYRIKCEHKFEPQYSFDGAFCVNVKIAIGSTALCGNTSLDNWISKSLCYNTIAVETLSCCSVFEFHGSKNIVKFLVIGVQNEN